MPSIEDLQLTIERLEQAHRDELSALHYDISMVESVVEHLFKATAFSQSVFAWLQRERPGWLSELPDDQRRRLGLAGDQLLLADGAMEAWMQRKTQRATDGETDG